MLQWLIRHTLRPLAHAVYRPHISGAIPPRGPVILAANHRSAIDTAALSLAVRRPVAFLGKAEYFEGTGLRAKMLAAFLGALGYVPVDRGNAHAALSALSAARTVLDSGGVFGIYPEGTRSLDGKLHRGHTGVASLALATGAVVVPVALSGTEKVQPIGTKLPRLARIGVRFGEPLDFARYDGLEQSPAIRRAVTDEIMYAIHELSGQEYVDSYHKLPDAA
ncbi:lysophospholipid acyltransferase family protein [Sciscionella marina]|uniref:lysophospholipid acyltransferase family protein n=1 Tax=Sciscionella marina TaxID=508770 RepID=UPI00035F65F6|nr:lysophospholipid acyltransferase family protein [Sciscionella marina]